MMTTNTMNRWALLVLLAALPLLAFAQSNTVGNVTGQVLDAQGSPVAGAEVTLTSNSTGVSRTTTTNDDGEFRFRALPIGSYSIEARAEAGVGKRTDVSVNVGTGSFVYVQLVADQAELDRISVSGQMISPVDITSTESATILTKETIDRIPVAQNVTAVALLAPGTVQGDGAFGNLASFGGASVGENAYFINGLDVTNFRNGLGGSTVPFEFYEEFQVKTGGYSAEFGRSTGGVVNAITKSGGNEFEAGITMIWEPGDLTSSLPNVFDNDGTIFTVNEPDSSDFSNVAVHASGPIVKDRLFFYALLNPRWFTSDNYGSSSYARSKQYSTFWGTKLDWYISDDHRVELTAFSDQRVTKSDSYYYDWETGIVGGYKGESLSNRGGRNIVAKYTGHLTDDLTLSIMAGKNAYDGTDSSPFDEICPVIIDARAGVSQRILGCWVNGVPSQQYDTRKQFRMDLEYAFGDNHFIRAGIDSQKNTSNDRTFYSGHVYWRYVDATPGDVIQGGVVPDGVTSLVRRRVFEGGGDFDVITRAWYVEDNWNITDTLLLSLGIRNESFDNRNALGETFIEIKDQWAPRLGLSWDVMGDGRSKVFANYGRYHLPIASNTNVRLSGAEYFIQEYYLFDSIGPDGTPQGLGEQIGATAVFGDGTVPDVREVVDQTIEPMYQDEFILGYEQELFDGWRAGIRGIYRDLKSTIEDVAIDAALNAYAAQNGYTDFHAGGFDYYVLTNPGTDMLIYVDMNGDGEVEPIQLSKEMLGYPESERTYKAIELFFEKNWDGEFYLQGSYTYSESKGNNEGYVRSDNGQDDAGLTTLFDQPGLLDGAYGPLPNDRPHTFKLFGAWQFADHWKVSGNFLAQSGRPINAFGVHPTDVFAAAYGAESFYENGVLVPRGSRGRTDFLTKLDLGLEYTTTLSGMDVQARVDIFNVFDSRTVTEVVETAETDEGTPDPAYLVPTRYQTPRYVRFTVRLNF